MILTRHLFPFLGMSSRKYSTLLQSFISSSDLFEILNPPSRPVNDETIFILDSSFNPPTNAHLALARSSLTPSVTSTIILLLAVQNADKQAKPASFAHRIEMMELLARGIEKTSNATALLALSKHPRFVDKAKEVAIAFPLAKQVVWLVGYDTLIRILDTKYYYPETLEESLKLFWGRNRLVCAVRGDEDVERAFMGKIRAGEIDGVPVSWAKYIKMIDPVGKEDSSTRVRKAAARENWEELTKLVPGEIAAYLQKEQLYTEE